MAKGMAAALTMAPHVQLAASFSDRRARVAEWSFLDRRIVVRLVIHGIHVSSSFLSITWDGLIKAGYWLFGSKKVSLCRLGPCYQFLRCCFLTDGVSLELEADYYQFLRCNFLTGIDSEKADGVAEGLVVTEVRKQLYLAGPLIVAWLLQNFVRMVSVMFVGHLGELALSSASIATSFANVTGFILMMGMASCLDKLCGQAFGAKQHHLLGIYKQRAILVLTLVSLVLAVVWWYTGKILLLFGQDPEIAAGAGSYIRWMIPALFV